MFGLRRWQRSPVQSRESEGANMVLTRRFGIISSLITVVLFVGLFAVPATTTQAQGASIVMTPDTTPQNTTVTIQLSGFRPNEVVTLWQTLPDLSVVGHGNYDVNEKGEATLLWHVDASTPTGRNYMSARGNDSRRVAITHFDLTLGEGMAADLPMSVSTTVDNQGSTFRFSAVGFGAHEYVSVWLRTPTNEVIDLGEVLSSREGTFDYQLFLGGDKAEGNYHLTAHGNTTNNTAIASFDLVRGDMLSAPTTPTLSIYPRTLQQNSTITIEGNNFGGDEDITAWITMPDARVVPLFDTRAENDGFFVVEIQLPSSVISGMHHITVFGKSSGLRAITTIQVLPRESGR